MKIIKKIKQVASGVKDYSQKSNAANLQADKNLRESNSFSKVSQDDNIRMVVKETDRIKKEKNISLRSSIRSKLGL